MNIDRRAVHPSKQTEGLLLISFQEQPSPRAKRRVRRTNARRDAESDLLRQLEQELKTTRDDLQSTIEELESANEELKASNEEVMSMNEELQSANEELETSKEELQSLNEELSTVNNQLHDKVEEVESATNDMANLLNCTDIATVFLDAGLRIKLFTPAATRMFNLIATDVGRPIGDIVKKFTDDDLLRRTRAAPARPDAARKGSAHRGRPLVHSADHALPHPGQPHRRRRDHLRGHHRAQTGRGRGRPAPRRRGREFRGRDLQQGPRRDHHRPGTAAPSGFTGTAATRPWADRSRCSSRKTAPTNGPRSWPRLRAASMSSSSRRSVSARTDSVSRWR